VLRHVQVPVRSPVVSTSPSFNEEKNSTTAFYQILNL
jgi:hypothetical protein